MPYDTRRFVSVLIDLSDAPQKQLSQLFSGIILFTFPLLVSGIDPRHLLGIQITFEGFFLVSLHLSIPQNSFVLLIIYKLVVKVSGKMRYLSRSINESRLQALLTRALSFSPPPRRVIFQSRWPRLWNSAKGPSDECRSRFGKTGVGTETTTRKKPRGGFGQTASLTKNFESPETSRHRKLSIASSPRIETWFLTLQIRYKPRHRAMFTISSSSNPCRPWIRTFDDTERHLRENSWIDWKENLPERVTSVDHEGTNSLPNYNFRNRPSRFVEANLFEKHESALVNVWSAIIVRHPRGQSVRVAKCKQLPEQL